MMNKMVEACSHCQAVYGCMHNDFERCPKIEIATEGLGVPSKQVDNSYIDHVPFGVFMGLKHIVQKQGVK